MKNQDTNFTKKELKKAIKKYGKKSSPAAIAIQMIIERTNNEESGC